MSKNTVTKEQKWAALNAKLRDDPTKLSSFYDNPVPVLEAAGIEMVHLPPAQIGAESTGESLKVTSHWWGQNFIMNEKLTDDIVKGIEGIGAVARLICAASGVGTVIAAAIATGFVLKKVEIQIVDNGKGVHWPITWAQWATILGGGVSAVMLFIHPLRN
ncbi:hypothetical protein ACFL7M_18890 [Thermodesulfobacteriota bacterium]